ncbi:hypothetical protein J3R82DRAFT_296 [Butyriboletus roseoflavus]|nr:hypothetical protein J3R82DRAFT_296 [Butyriboletus roseoflavus]
METIDHYRTEMIGAVSKGKVLAGDVVVIDKTWGIVSKLGRSFARSRDYDVTLYLPNPDTIQVPSSRQTTSSTAEHKVSSFSASDTREMKPELRDQMNTKVAEWREDGKFSGVGFPSSRMIGLLTTRACRCC